MKHKPHKFPLVLGQIMTTPPDTTTIFIYIIDTATEISKGYTREDHPAWTLKTYNFYWDQPHIEARKSKRQTYKPRLSRADTDLRENHARMEHFFKGALEEAKRRWDISMFENLEKEGGNDEWEEIDFKARGLVEMMKLVKRGFGKVSECDMPVNVTLTEDTEIELSDLYDTVITNSSLDVKIITAMPGKHRYLIPPKAYFLMSDLAEIEKLIPCAKRIGGYDLIVIDPPWPNKSAHRSLRYETQDIYSLFQIPVKDLFCSSNSYNELALLPLVIVWITNKPKFRHFVKEKLFPAWNLECVGEWYWIKPIIPLDSIHRKPYEPLLIGRPKSSYLSLPEFPYQRTIVAPSSRHHSRKPPLGETLSDFLPTEPKCLELFARCLMPGWTSWGNECLRFQDENWFSSV